MKSKTLKLTTLALLPASLLTLTSCSTTSAPPPVGSSRLIYSKWAPGAVIIQTVEMTAIVTAFDPAKRIATLRPPNRNEFIVNVGTEVNLDQVRVGDRVNATVVEKLVASPAKEEGSSGGGTDAKQVAEVVAIDSEKRTATLRFGVDDIRTFPISDHLDLSRHKVGERIVYRFTERSVIKIEKLH